MKVLLEALSAYLYKTTNIKVSSRPWKGQKTLPFFLADLYSFYEISFLEHPCLLIVAKEDNETTPTTMRKHRELIQEKWSGLCIFVQSTISSYNRKYLIEYRIPFIIPGNQMYLPELGIDLREHYRKQHENSKNKISPAAQVVLIYILLQKTQEKLTPSELARKLGYSRMSMTRAFDELKVANICDVQKKGRESHLLVKGSKYELWERAKGLMRTPVKCLAWLSEENSMTISGLSALAHFSMLNSPSIPVYAMSAEKWKQSLIQELPSVEKALVELEIWHYDPNLFAQKNVVDPFSLYLSLRSNEDERIESALEEMMENIVW